MSLSDCEKCWDTPCTCGHQYRGWTPEALASLIAVLQTAHANALALRNAATCNHLVTCEGACSDKTEGNPFESTLKLLPAQLAALEEARASQPAFAPIPVHRGMSLLKLGAAPCSRCGGAGVIESWECTVPCPNCGGHR